MLTSKFLGFVLWMERSGVGLQDRDPESKCRFLDSLRSLGMTLWRCARSE
jgi:hypothetical protein